jgi:hypothetical protein
VEFKKDSHLPFYVITGTCDENKHEKCYNSLSLFKIEKSETHMQFYKAELNGEGNWDWNGMFHYSNVLLRCKAENSLFVTKTRVTRFNRLLSSEVGGHSGKPVIFTQKHT